MRQKERKIEQGGKNYQEAQKSRKTSVGKMSRSESNSMAAEILGNHLCVSPEKIYDWARKYRVSLHKHFGDFSRDRKDDFIEKVCWDKPLKERDK